MLKIEHKVDIILKAINMGHPIARIFLPSKCNINEVIDFAEKISDKKFINLAADITINQAIKGTL